QGAKHVKDCRQLLFGEEVDLQIKMGTFVSLTCHTILRHQDEHGKKNGLQRYDQRQKAEWKGVEWRDSRPPQIDHKPANKPHEVNDRKRRSTSRSADRVAQAVGGRWFSE